MNLSVFSQPEFITGALIILLIFQIVTIILLINLHLKFTPSRTLDIKDAKQKTDADIKQASERLRDDEKRQERIRQNYDADHSKDQKPFKDQPRNPQDRNFNRDRDRDRDRGRDRDQGRDRDRDRNRDRGPDRDRDRNRNRDGGGDRQGFRPPFNPGQNRERAPISPVIEKPIEAAAAPLPVVDIPAPMSENEQDFGHGRRPIVKRRHLPGGAEGGEIGQETAFSVAETAPAAAPEATSAENEENKNS